MSRPEYRAYWRDKVEHLQGHTAKSGGPQRRGPGVRRPLAKAASALMSHFTDLFKRRAAPEDMEEVDLLERHPDFVAVRLGPAGVEGLVCLRIDSLGASAVRIDARRIQEHPELRGQVLAFLDAFAKDPDVLKNHPREVSHAEADLRSLRRA